MKIKKEALVGFTIVLAMFAIIAAVTGIYGVLYLSLAFIVAIISINLFSRKSVAAKTGAVILNTDLIYKILMPRKYKRAIRKLEERKHHEKT